MYLKYKYDESEGKYGGNPEWEWTKPGYPITKGKIYKAYKNDEIIDDYTFKYYIIMDNGEKEYFDSNCIFRDNFDEVTLGEVRKLKLEKLNGGS